MLLECNTPLDIALPAPPVEGGGVHAWLFRVSCLMWRRGCNAAEIAEYLNRTSPRVLEREIGDAIRNAAKAVGINNSGADGDYGLHEHEGPREKKMPSAAVDEARIEQLARRTPDAFDRLRTASPDELHLSSSALIDLLSPGNPLVCMAGAEGPATARTAPREAWRGQEDLHPLIVPNPMTAPTRLNQSGRPSARCLANTGPRRYLVIESDYRKVDLGSPDLLTTLNLQASVFLHLAENFRKPALVCFSGRGSLHAWFPVLPDDIDGPGGTLFEFHKYAVSLGCDPATWLRCQLVRTPGAYRGGGGLQIVLYFDRTQIHPA